MNKKTTILISKLDKVPGSSKRYQTFQPLKDVNLECLKKSAQEAEDFQNMFQIKPKTQIIFVIVFFTLLVVSCGIGLRFPQKLFVRYEDGFFEITRFLALYYYRRNFRLDYQPLFGKMSPHQRPDSGDGGNRA